MASILIIYSIIITTIGIYDFFKIKTVDDFVLAGRNRSQSSVAASILATVIGASATIGVVNLAYKEGLVSMLWLSSGAVGLMISAIFIARKIRNCQAQTLTEVAQKLIGNRCAAIMTFVIIIAWVGIVAAQYIAAAKIVSGFIEIEYASALIITASLIILYCTAGGQLSVFKTDLVQLLIVLAAISMTIVFLFKKDFSLDIWSAQNLGKITLAKTTYFMLIVGSGFVVGPDIFGRFFAAKSDSSALKGGIIAAITLGLVSAAIVSIGLWVRQYGNITEGEDAFVWVMQTQLPPFAAAVLTLGLLSAIISSADTCLITASSILNRQITSQNSLKQLRAITAIIGIAAFVLAFVRADIISTLLLSYSVFNCGIIAPMLLAILLAEHKRLNEHLVIAAMITGGALGAYSNIKSNDNMAIAAFALSTILSFAAVIKGSKKKA